MVIYNQTLYIERILRAREKPIETMLLYELVEKRVGEDIPWRNFYQTIKRLEDQKRIKRKGYYTGLPRQFEPEISEDTWKVCPY